MIHFCQLEKRIYNFLKIIILNISKFYSNVYEFNNRGNNDFDEFVDT